jgi:chromosome segregation ATPase
MSKQSVYEVIPLKVLEQISAYEEQAAELEHKAASLQADAQDLLLRAEDIVEYYRQRIREYGWDACKAEAERKDAFAWRFDPLPGQGAHAR